MRREEKASSDDVSMRRLRPGRGRRDEDTMRELEERERCKGQVTHGMTRARKNSYIRQIMDGTSDADRQKHRNDAATTVGGAL